MNHYTVLEQAGIAMSSIQSEKKRHTLLHLLSLVLVITINGVEITVLILTTFFGKMVTALKFIPFLAPVFDGINTLYHVYKLTLKPIPLPLKCIIGLASVSSYLLGTVPSFIVNLLAIVNVSAINWLTLACPFFILASLGITTVLNGLGLFDAAHEYATKPWSRNPGNTLKLVSRCVKTTTFALLTAVAIPFLLATGGILITASLTNPFTAGPVAATLFSVMIAACVVLIAMKITKTIIQRRLQAQQAIEAAQQTKTPYDILGIDAKKLEAASYKERKQLLVMQYKNNEASILKHVKNKEKQFKKLKKNYQAYALLRNASATQLYQVCENIKAGKNDKALPPPEQILKLGKGLSQFRPYLWCHYQIQKYFAKEEEKQKIELAYQILTHSKLYDYYKTVEQDFKIKKRSQENSSSKIWSSLGIKRPLNIHNNKRFISGSSSDLIEIRKHYYPKIQENDSKPAMRRSL